MTALPPKRAKVHEQPCYANGYRWEIRTDDGDVIHMSGFGCPPNNTRTGDRIVIEYISASNMGYWAYVRDDK